jgi:hypothetical protein
MIAFQETVAADTDLAMAAFPSHPSVPGTDLVSAAALAPDTEALGDEIARLAAHLHAATYQLLVLIRAFDEQEGWGGGFLSCAHWLSWRTGIGPGPAREKVRVARALAVLPHISGAMARGEQSFSKIRALTRVATPENEEELLEIARHATAAHVETLVRAWRRVDRLEEAELEAERHQSRYFRLYPEEDGSWVLRGRLDPEVGALLEKALEWASEALYRKERIEAPGEGEDIREEAEIDAAPTAEQRRADGLGLLAERALAESTTAPANGSSPPLGRADRFQVVVHMEAGKGKNVPAGTFGLGIPAEPKGLIVPEDTARRLACDAAVVHMIHDAVGGVLDVGRRRRTVPPALRRALDYRDGGCRFPGCGVRYFDAHHIVHWADGGGTKLENLVNLCKRHHRAVHEGGFRVEVVVDEGIPVDRGCAGGPEIRFLRPDGRTIPVVPDSPPVPADAAEALAREHQRKDILPDAWTATPLWQGEVFDLGMAVEGLRGTPVYHPS